MDWRLVKDGKAMAYLLARPHYCDRGRYHLLLNVPMWQSDADRGIRYYFDLERGKAEVEDYLKAKKFDLAGAIWEPDEGTDEEKIAILQGHVE